MNSFKSMYIINKCIYAKVSKNISNVQRQSSVQQSGGYNNINNKQTSHYYSDVIKNYNKCGGPDSNGSGSNESASNDGCGGRSYE
jgi:hypothetical protein